FLQGLMKFNKGIFDTKVVIFGAKVFIFGVYGLPLLGALFFTVVGVATLIPAPAPTDITHRKPFADYIGREYRVVSRVSAHAWNDFPDRAKILTITLEPPPGVGNRFVSWKRPLKLGQRVHIISAWRYLALDGFVKYYVVSVPDAGLPGGIEIRMKVGSD